MLYIMRHGQTDWNKQKKLQGKTDIPLNRNGYLSALEAKKAFKNSNFDICFCSPLLRAKETAEIFLNGKNIPVFTDIRLAEMSFGELEGVKDYFNLPENDKSTLFNHPEKYKGGVLGAETFEELFSRTGEFLKERVFPLLNSGKDVLIVSHGAVLCAIVSQIKNIPLKDFWSVLPQSCEIKKID